MIYPVLANQAGNRSWVREFVAQELLGHIARQNSMPPAGPVLIDGGMQRGILNRVRSKTHEFHRLGRVNAMSIRRVVPNIQSERMDESRRFYVELLGLEVAMDMDWIITLVSPSNPTAQISLVRGPALQAPQSQLTLSVEVADVDAVHTKAVAMEIPIVYPLTTEPWGVRRFHVTDPNGVVINIMSHQA